MNKKRYNPAKKETFENDIPKEDNRPSIILGRWSATYYKRGIIEVVRSNRSVLNLTGYDLPYKKTFATTKDLSFHKAEKALYKAIEEAKEDLIKKIGL